MDGVAEVGGGFFHRCCCLGEEEREETPFSLALCSSQGLFQYYYLIRNLRERPPTDRFPAIFFRGLDTPDALLPHEISPLSHQPLLYGRPALICNVFSTMQLEGRGTYCGR